MVKSDAYNGEQRYNPFNFKHYNATSMDVLVNSKSAYGRPLTMNFGANQYIYPYMHLMSALGYLDEIILVILVEVNTKMETHYTEWI